MFVKGSYNILCVLDRATHFLKKEMCQDLRKQALANPYLRTYNNFKLITIDSRRIHP